MSIAFRAGKYLEAITTAVRRLSEIVYLEQISADFMFKTISEIKELEQSTADFINDLELDHSASEAVRRCKSSFILSNERIIRYLEKIQSQGLNFDKHISALKLENETLQEEINFL